jgi:hypothetical protein
MDYKKAILKRAELVDINEIASKLNFQPARKKPVGYVMSNHSTAEDLRPLEYTIADKDQVVETYTSDGKETTNTAHKGDFIFSGPSGELYVLKPSKVQKVYTGSIGGTLTPEQSNRSVTLYNGPEINFTAPWGESMVLKPGDYLVKEQDNSGYYRIAKKEFEQTYELQGK